MNHFSAEITRIETLIKNTESIIAQYQAELVEHKEFLRQTKLEARLQ